MPVLTPAAKTLVVSQTGRRKLGEAKFLVERASKNLTTAVKLFNLVKRDTDRIERRVTEVLRDRNPRDLRALEAAGVDVGDLDEVAQDLGIAHDDAQDEIDELIEVMRDAVEALRAAVRVAGDHSPRPKRA